MEENTNVEIIERGYFDVTSRRKSALISVLFYVAAMYVINLFIQIFLISFHKRSITSSKNTK